MRFLSVALDPVRGDADELERTILGRVAGVRRLGHQSDCVYDCRNELFLIENDETRRLPLPERREERERAFCDAVCGLICRAPYDYLYFTGLFLTPSFLKIAACAKEKKFSAKVIFEREQ